MVKCNIDDDDRGMMSLLILRVELGVFPKTCSYFGNHWPMRRRK